MKCMLFLFYLISVYCLFARETYVTNFDFTSHANATYNNGKAAKIGNFWYQNDYSVTSQGIQVGNGILAFTADKDDEAFIMDIPSETYADRSYFARAVVKFPNNSGFYYSGILIHADVGGTAHPETEGVGFGIARYNNKWWPSMKQWTDGHLYGEPWGDPSLADFDPNKWYVLQVEVKPRGSEDTQFSGRLWEASNQANPTVADIGALKVSFDNRWNPRSGQWDNSEDPQWNPRIHNIGLFQWYKSGHLFHSFGIAKTEEGFKKPLIYAAEKTITSGSTVHFKSSGMYAVQNYNWDFGDGTSSTQANPVKTYAKEGAYTVTLTATYANGRGTYISESLVIHVLPASGSQSSSDNYASGVHGWTYEDIGLNGLSSADCDPLYILGTHDPTQGSGALKIEAFNYSPGSPSQSGSNYTLYNWDLMGVSGQWTKTVNLAQQDNITFSFKYKLATSGLDSDHDFKILVTDNGSIKKSVSFTDDQNTGFVSGSIQFQAAAGMHKIGLGLWCEVLSTKPVQLDAHTGGDSPTGSSPRRCDLNTHRWDHWDDNGKINVWIDEVNINIQGSGPSGPVPGEIVATYVIPSQFNSLNGLAWDGSQAWGVDYVGTASGKAYRLDLVSAVPGATPSITRTLALNLHSMEGAGHNGNGTLFTGPRTNGSRSSAQIIACNDQTGSQGNSYTSFLWPDGQPHGDYKDPDGIAFGNGNIFWVCNADHSTPTKAGIQVMTPGNTVVKRFWLPDEKPNDVAYAGEYLIYKPHEKDGDINQRNVIKIVDVSKTANGGNAVIAQTITISKGIVTKHWGAAHDGSTYLYLSQDQPGDTIFKIYLPVSGTVGDDIEKKKEDEETRILEVGPNPFNPNVNIRVKCKVQNAKCKVQIFNINGKMVDDLTSKFNHLQSSIFNKINWNASDFPSGIYILKAKIGNRQISRKLALQR